MPTRYRLLFNIEPLDKSKIMSTVSASFTRPSNVSPNYSIGNVIGNGSIITFTDIVPINGRSGSITTALLTTNNKDCIAQCRLYLYTTIPVAIADNSPFTLLYSNVASEVGIIDFPPFMTEGVGSTAAMAVWVDRLDFVCASNDVNLYGVLVSETVFTPASAQNFYIKLVTSG
jgi:hypothetical protein